MQYPSPHSGLFGSSGVDPRSYHGPPNLRRSRTPAAEVSRAQSSDVRRGNSSMGCGPVSLNDYDDSQGQAVNTPRSLAACAKIGISPQELLRPTLKETVVEMKRLKENTADREIVKMRHTFYSQMQQRKLKAAVEAYWTVCDEEALTPTKRGTGTIDSTKVMNEEKQLRKIVETNKSRLRQQILRAQLLQKQRQKEDERLEAQRQADIKKKEDMVVAMAERSKKEEEAAALRNQAREIERAQMAAAADAARRRYEEQDSELSMRMEERRLALDESNSLRRSINKERQARMKAQSETVVTLRREELESRMESFEHEHQARMRQKEIEHARKRSEAEARAVKIQEAIHRSNAQLQAKVLMTEAKSAAVERRLRDFATDRAAKRMSALEDEMEKEAKRQETYDQAIAVQQERVHTFINRMNENDARQQDLHAQKNYERRINHEVSRQKMLMKQDAVERQRKVDESDRARLIETVQSKGARIVAMKESHLEMKAQRKAHREEAERTRVKLTEVTPGPSDYVVLDGECGTNGPQWKMGLPASAAGPRVVIKNHPTPGYDHSPGPAAYSVGGVDESRHRNRAAYSFTKAERFDYGQ